MKQRGRKSAANLSIVPGVVDERPPAPDDLLPHEREQWNSITAPREPAFFDDAILPLLKEYCRLTSQVALMAEQIEAFDMEWLAVEDGAKQYKLISDIRDKAQGRLISLARSMRLTPQSRYQPDKSSVKPRAKTATRKIWAKD